MRIFVMPVCYYRTKANRSCQSDIIEQDIKKFWSEYWGKTVKSCLACRTYDAERKIKSKEVKTISPFIPIAKLSSRTRQMLREIRKESD